jgi:hypothetical protein
MLAVAHHLFLASLAEDMDQHGVIYSQSCVAVTFLHAVGSSAGAAVSILLAVNMFSWLPIARLEGPIKFDHRSFNFVNICNGEGRVCHCVSGPQAHS